LTSAEPLRMGTKNHSSDWVAMHEKRGFVSGALQKATRLLPDTLRGSWTAGRGPR
jgi:hypothetical protein